jgi:ABC-type taurine transport system substrate-binding protein
VQAALIEQTSKGKKASTAKVVEALRGLSFYTPDEQLIDVLMNGTSCRSHLRARTHVTRALCLRRR